MGPENCKITIDCINDHCRGWFVAFTILMRVKCHSFCKYLVFPLQWSVLLQCLAPRLCPKVWAACPLWAAWTVEEQSPSQVCEHRSASLFYQSLDTLSVLLLLLWPKESHSWLRRETKNSGSFDPGGCQKDPCDGRYSHGARQRSHDDDHRPCCYARTRGKSCILVQGNGRRRIWLHLYHSQLIMLIFLD